MKLYKLLSVFMLVLVLVLLPLASAVTWDNTNYWDMGTLNPTENEVDGAVDLTENSNPQLVTGKISNATDFDGDDALNGSTSTADIGTNSFSISIWIKDNSSLVNSDSERVWIETKGSNAGFSLMTNADSFVGDSGVNFGVKDGGSDFTQTGAENLFDGTTGWNHFVVTYDNSTGNATIYHNGQAITSAVDLNIDDISSSTSFWVGAEPGPTHFVNTSLDEIGIWERKLSQSEISELYNNGNGVGYKGEPMRIILGEPEDNTVLSATGTNFTAGGNNMSGLGYNWTNVTFKLWKDGSKFNFTTVDFDGEKNQFIETQFIDDFTLGDYKWNAYGCYKNASYSNCIYASDNYTFTASSSQSNPQYASSVWDTSNHKFNVSINAFPGIQSITANLWYNGSKYTSTIKEISNNDYKLKNKIDISPQKASSGTNKSFFWELKQKQSDGSIIRQNLSSFSHEVNKTLLVDCNSSITNEYFNFTTHTAKNPYPKLNATFKSSWNYWLGSGNVKKNYSYEDVAENNVSWDFCFNTNKSIYVDTDIVFNAKGYNQNYHYFSNLSIDKSETKITDLYLINESKATITVLKAQDGAQEPLEDVYISIQKYDIGTDTYYTVGMAKTSPQGKDSVYLNWYDTLYKFVLVQDGETIKTTDPYKVTETPQIFDVIRETIFTYNKFEDFEWDLSFNESSDQFILTFVKPSGDVDKGCLRVIKKNFSGNFEVCETCEESSSATLYCDISDYGNGTFLGSFYATGSLKFMDLFQQIQGGRNKIYQELGNMQGTALAFIFAGIATFASLISIVWGVVGALLGFIGAAAFGFQKVNYMVYLTMTVVGVLIIWFLKK